MGHLLIEAVDALDHQNVRGPQAHEIALVLPHALLEIVIGQLHLLPCQKLQHIPVKLLQIQTFQGLVVVVALFVPGAVHPVHKVIVHGNGMGL